MLAAAIIGAAISAATAIYGGVKSGNERKKMARYLQQQESENKAWYDANYNSDYLQRADSQNLIRHMRDTLKRQNKAVSNSAAITGATPEQQAAQKEQSMQAISNVYGGLGAQGQRYKDNVLNQYINRKNNMGASQFGMMSDSTNYYHNLMNQGLQQAPSSAQAIIEAWPTKK